jgi:hypothetical protein
MSADEHLLYPVCMAALIHNGVILPGAWTHCTRCNAADEAHCGDREAREAQINEGKSE